VQNALGSRKRHILLQFMAEALTITFIGGVLGVVLAYVVALSVGRLTLYSAFAKNGETGDIRLIIAPGTLIASTLILAVVGLVSGMVPAFRVPIEALRFAQAAIAGTSRFRCTDKWPINDARLQVRLHERRHEIISGLARNQRPY